MDHSFNVTVAEFIDTLNAAAEQLDTVQPEALREPLALWFRSTAQAAQDLGWRNLWGRPVVAIYNAARAILDQPSTKDRAQ